VTALVAISAGKAILIGVSAGLAVVLAAGALLAGQRRKRRAPGVDIPPGMRSGPSDTDLEKPILERMMAWGAVLVLFQAVWIPVVFLTENRTNENDLRQMTADSVQRGKLTTMPQSEENPFGFNCERCHGPGLHGGQNVFNGSIVVVPNLQTVCGGSAFGHPQIHKLQDVVDTIAMGRTNTDMPSWSVRFTGSMDDQQINDLLNYILSIQEVPFAQNLCTNPKAGASPTPSASPGASPSPIVSASPSGAPSASPSPSGSYSP
jgi:mono/diheme cytochrome c family protein